MKTKLLISWLIPGLILGLVLAPTVSAIEITSGDYQGRDDVVAFVQRVAAASTYSEQELVDLFGQVEKQEHLFAKLDKPAEKELEWWQYRRLAFPALILTIMNHNLIRPDLIRGSLTSFPGLQLQLLTRSQMP